MTYSKTLYSVPFANFPYHIFPTHFHLSHHPTLSLHTLPALISTARTIDYCALAITRPRLCPYVCVGRRILFLKPLFTFIDKFLPLIALHREPITILLFTTLSFISPAISPCLSKTAPQSEQLHFLHCHSYQNYPTPFHCWYTHSAWHSEVTHFHLLLKHLALPDMYSLLPFHTHTL